MSPGRSILSALLFGLSALAGASADDGMTHERLAAIRSVTSVSASPDGSRVAYTLSVPRTPGVDDDGRAWTELHLTSTSGDWGRPFVHGAVNVSQVRFTADGSMVTYVAKRADDEHSSLWGIALDGGESRRLIEHETSVLAYAISTDGRRVAFVAREEKSEDRSTLEEKGYTQEVYEEDWRHRRLWIATLDDRAAPRDPMAAAVEATEPSMLEIDGSVFAIDWFPDGRSLAVSIAPRPLIDDQYMMQRVHVIDADSGEIRARLDNTGKLGRFRVSPDGARIAMITAADLNDPRAGRLMVGAVGGGALRDLLPDAPMHVDDFDWIDGTTLVYNADRGAETELGRVDVRGKARVLQRSGPSSGPVLTAVDASRDGSLLIGIGERPTHPAEVVALDGGTARRLTESNPWLDEVALAQQDVIRWTARDGLELEGVLIRPLKPIHGTPAPLLLMVHGGPESQDRNGWLSNYSRPGQIAAARGYAVLYPNYRGSTGRGVAFSKLSQGDAAGKEFDDLVDAIDHLAQVGIADPDRVGINGGSYGGYATAWCSTRYSDRFRAGVMFVGISNKLSKGWTTEVPVEDDLVHTRFEPWTRWE